MSKSPYRVQNIPDGVAIPDLSFNKSRKSNQNDTSTNIDFYESNFTKHRRSCDCRQFQEIRQQRQGSRDLKFNQLYSSSRDLKVLQDSSIDDVPRQQTLRFRPDQRLPQDHSLNIIAVNNTKKLTKSVVFEHIDLKQADRTFNAATQDKQALFINEFSSTTNPRSAGAVKAQRQ